MRYQRRFDAAGSDSLAKLARWIRPGATVLELGSAGGYFTAFLKSQGCAVDIVEIDAGAAGEARQHARRTLVADLEGDAWTGQLGDARYDLVVCADVLEHLRDGARLLGRLRPLLSPGGELLLSVPNVAHSAVIANLVDDRFEYGGEGLLDPTHVRLYTWRSLAGLLRDAGFGILEWDATTLGGFETEFRVRSEALPGALSDALGRRPHGRVYQWLVRAAPDAVDSAAEPSPMDAIERIPVRLLHADSPEALSLERCVSVGVPIGGVPVEVEWQWPARSAAFRLLLADRIGVIRVHRLHLRAGDDVLWSLDDRDANLERAASVARLDAVTFALTAPDGWIAPAVTPDVAMRADRLTATLAWPAGMGENSAGFTLFAALSNAFSTSVEANGRLRDELTAALNLAERRGADELAAHETTRKSLEDARVAFARRDDDVATLEAAVAGYRAENARLEAAVAAQERIIVYRQSARWWVRLPLVRVKLWWHRWTS